MVTALDQPSDRVKGLESGADDFLTKPVSDVALIARVRSLSRLKMMTDELRMRAVTSREIGIENPEREALAEAGRNGRILVVDDRPALSDRIVSTCWRASTRSTWSAIPNEALVPRRRGQLRPGDRLARSGEFRRLAAVQPAPLARAHPQRADPRDRRGRQQYAPGARAGDRRQRLSGAARSTRTRCWRACAPRSARSATPSGCATTCSCRSRWRSPMR